MRLYDRDVEFENIPMESISQVSVKPITPTSYVCHDRSLEDDSQELVWIPNGVPRTIPLVLILFIKQQCSLCLTLHLVLCSSTCCMVIATLITFIYFLIHVLNHEVGNCSTSRSHISRTVQARRSTSCPRSARARLI